MVEYEDRFSVRSSIISAAYLGPLNTVAQVDPICTSAHCDWEAYGSLAVCSRLVNITDPLLRSQVSMATFTGFNLLYNESSSLVNNTFPNEPLFHSVILPFSQPSGLFDPKLRAVTLSELFIAFSDGINTRTGPLDMSKFHYMAFSFYYCTKSYNTTVSEGKAVTQELAQTSEVLSSTVDTLNPLWNPQMRGFVSATDFCPQEVVTQSLTIAAPPGLSPNDFNYTIDACTGLAISAVVWGSISGSTVMNSKLQIYANQGEVNLPLSIALYAPHDLFDAFDPVVREKNMGKMVENIATGLSNT
jgi:hypothetical protein